MRRAALLERLLAGSLPDPDGGGLLSVPTCAVVIEPGLLDHALAVLGRLGLGRRLAVVSDDNTHAVLGARVERALASIATVTRIGLGSPVHPDGATSARIEAAAAAADALIAVGSGTINDLCKYAGACSGKPYTVFATAPSMNGYTSQNAAITLAGHKKSLPAQSAAAVFMDLDVLCAAPARLIRAGLGDSLCRPTAQADWLLAHLLQDEPYREAPFALLAEDEAPLFAHSDALLAGDGEAMAGLARTLTLSGFGMTLAGGSQPASQGEHLISHYAEMLRDPAWPEALHGEQVGVATLTMARLQRLLLEGDAPRLRPTTLSEADFVARYGADRGASWWRAFASKHLDPARADRLNQRLAERWPRIRERIAAIHLPAEDLERVLVRAGAPTTPEALGWPSAFYREAVLHAREIRERYTFLDLAADAGLDLAADAGGLESLIGS